MKLITLFAVIGVLCSAVAEENGSDEKIGQQILDQVTEEDRPHFIALHLALGLGLERDATNFRIPDDINIPEDTYEKFQDLNVPDEFSFKLLRWCEAEYNMTDANVMEMLRESQICFPSGCVDPGDVGTQCCPF